MKNTSEVRSDLNMGTLLFSVKTGEPQAVNSAPKVFSSGLNRTLPTVTDTTTTTFLLWLYQSDIFKSVRVFHFSWILFSIGFKRMNIISWYFGYLRFYHERMGSIRNFPKWILQNLSNIFVKNKCSEFQTQSPCTRDRGDTTVSWRHR